MGILQFPRARGGSLTASRGVQLRYPLNDRSPAEEAQVLKRADEFPVRGTVAILSTRSYSTNEAHEQHAQAHRRSAPGTEIQRPMNRSANWYKRRPITEGAGSRTERPPSRRMTAPQGRLKPSHRPHVGSFSCGFIYSFSPAMAAQRRRIPTSSAPLPRRPARWW